MIQAEAASSVGSASVGCSGTTITGRRDDGRLLAHYGVPFEPGDDFWLHYSYVVCDSLPPTGLDDATQEQGFSLLPVGSLARGSGIVRLRLTMPTAGAIWVDIYGADGRLVRAVSREARAAPGMNDLTWNLLGDDGRRVATGVYFVKARAALDKGGKTVQITRVTVVR